MSKSVEIEVHGFDSESLAASCHLECTKKVAIGFGQKLLKMFQQQCSDGKSWKESLVVTDEDTDEILHQEERES